MLVHTGVQPGRHDTRVAERHPAQSSDVNTTDVSGGCLMRRTPTTLTEIC